MKPTQDARLLGDQRLMEDVAAGNQEAKKELVVRLWRRVNNTARHLAHYDDEAEDMTQEALLQILKSAVSFRADGCLEAWADVIAVRTIMKHLRRLRWARRMFGTQLHEPGVGDGDGDPEQRLLRKDQSARVAELLSRLKPDRQVALVLKLVCGYSVEEVAEIVDQPSDTVRYQLRKGRAELRRLVLRDRGFRDLLSGRR